MIIYRENNWLDKNFIFKFNDGTKIGIYNDSLTGFPNINNHNCSEWESDPDYEEVIIKIIDHQYFYNTYVNPDFWKKVMPKLSKDQQDEFRSAMMFCKTLNNIDRILEHMTKVLDERD